MERDLGSHRPAWESLGQSLHCQGVPPQPLSLSRWQGESYSPGFLSWALCTTDNSKTGPVMEACIPGQPRTWVWKSPMCIFEEGMLVDSFLKSSQSMGGWQGGRLWESWWVKSHLWEHRRHPSPPRTGSRGADNWAQLLHQQVLIEGPSYRLWYCFHKKKGENIDGWISGKIRSLGRMTLML